MGSSLILRHLCFVGPEKERAFLQFGEGLNIVYGASETGKSFVFESLNFMLGGSAALRDIPERVGYDRIFLGVVATDGTEFTLERSASGGQFRLYEGLHSDTPEDVEPVVLRAQHNPTRDDNLSRYLLSKIELDGKRVRKNASGETVSLSFRHLAHFVLVSEGDIQKRESPIETGQFVTRTIELSTLKLLLTGVDDSAVQPAERDSSERLSRAAKIEVIDELILEYRGRLTSLVGDEDDVKELQEQLERLDSSLDREREMLRGSEQSYRNALQRRNELRRRMELAQERRSEIDEIVSRFALLDAHYQSDLARLEGIREAGSLVTALDQQPCPLCGSAPESQHLDSECDGNIDAIVNAADAESAKIGRLQRELRDTVAQLHREARSFDELAPQIREQLRGAQTELENATPSVTGQRAAYTELLDTRSRVQSALNMLGSISELERRRLDVEDGGQQPSTPANVPIADVSFSTLDKFSQVIEDVLKSWNFPESERVFFDKDSRDFVIAGKPRGARGKGMRAITHSAFTVGLLEYIRLNDLPHPGFVILDTPLLAYREPEGDEDDLTGTDVQERFYEFLGGRTDRQSIILENVDPPTEVANRPNVTFFSRNPHSGRYGFFPV